MTESQSVYGVIAEFDDPTAFVEAARAVRKRGYRKFEAYSPYPIKDLFKIVPGGNPVPLIVLTGGVLGAATAWTMQYYIAAIDYPINVGGRPLYSWPAFVPILFELTVLLAALAAFFGTLYLCGFPKAALSNCSILRSSPAAAATGSSCALTGSRSDLRCPSHNGLSATNSEPIGVWQVEAD